MTEAQREDLEKAHRADWDSNKDGCRQSFVSFKAYSGYCRSKAEGRVKEHAPKEKPAIAQAPAKLLAPAAAKAQAAQEWASGFDGCRGRFSSEAAYIGYRAAVLEGRAR